MPDGSSNATSDFGTDVGVTDTDVTAPGTGLLAEEVAGLDDGLRLLSILKSTVQFVECPRDRITDLLSRSCGGGTGCCSSGSFNHGLSTKVPGTVLSWRDEVGAALVGFFRLVLEASLCSFDLRRYQISSYYETVP